MTRIAHALHSSDLTQKEGGCDVDTVRALGLTAIHRQLGVLVVEALEGCAGDSPHDAARVRDLISAVQKIVQSQADRDGIAVRNWPVAEFMVRELILDRCPRCGGRGFLPLEYGPSATDDLKGEDCPDCHGSGRARRDFHGRSRAAGHETYSLALKRFYEALEGRLSEAEGAARWHYGLRFGRYNDYLSRYDERN
jgi:hypothetical protein